MRRGKSEIQIQRKWVDGIFICNIAVFWGLTPCSLVAGGLPKRTINLVPPSVGCELAFRMTGKHTVSVLIW